jgi:hypothetical protein
MSANHPDLAIALEVHLRPVLTGEADTGLQPSVWAARDPLQTAPQSRNRGVKQGIAGKMVWERRVKIFGIALYVVATLPVLFGVYAAWFLTVWGFDPLMLLPGFGVLGVASWGLWFTGRVLRSKPVRKPDGTRFPRRQRP